MRADRPGPCVYRKFRISRIMLRKLALEGKIPGMRKASW
jgi:small subunit ribosomal protein S14